MITEEGPLDLSFMGKLVDTIEARSDGSAAAVVQVNSGTETEVSEKDGYGGGTATPDGWLRGSYHEEAHISSLYASTCPSLTCSTSSSYYCASASSSAAAASPQNKEKKQKHNNTKKKSSKSERDKLKRRALLLIQDGQDQGQGGSEG